MYFSDINVFNVSWTNLCHICSSYQRQHSGLCHYRWAQIPLQAVACCVWTWLRPSLALSEWWFSHPMHSSTPSVRPRHPTIQVGPCTYNRDCNMLQSWLCVSQSWSNLCQLWSKSMTYMQYPCSENGPGTPSSCDPYTPAISIIASSRKVSFVLSSLTNSMTHCILNLKEIW